MRRMGTALRILLACWCLIILFGTSAVVRAQDGLAGPQRPSISPPQPQFVLPPRGSSTVPPFLFAACSMPIMTGSGGSVTFVSNTGTANVIAANGIFLQNDLASVEISQTGIYFIHFSADAVTAVATPVPAVQLYVDGAPAPGDYPGLAWHVGGLGNGSTGSVSGDELFIVLKVPTVLRFVSTENIGIANGCKLVIQRIG